MLYFIFLLLSCVLQLRERQKQKCVFLGYFPQISEIHVTGESEDMTAKERLLLWSRQLSDGYVGVRCENFTTSWRDGRLFNAIIHKYR